MNKKSFVRYVSHEIRTPLNTGKVLLRLLLVLILLSVDFVMHVSSLSRYSIAHHRIEREM